MIIVALGLMMDAAEPGRYSRGRVRSRERVIWIQNLRRSDFYKRHRNRAAARHLETGARSFLHFSPTPLEAA